MKKERCFMKGRINDKITEIEAYLYDLSNIRPKTLEEYKSNIEKRLACERLCEKIIEACTDLSFLIFKENIAIKDKNVSIPRDDLAVFDILALNKIITLQLAEKLKDAKRMRNVIVHLYGKIDDVKVFHAIDEELEPDINEFLDSIKLILEEEGLK